MNDVSLPQKVTPCGSGCTNNIVRLHCTPPCPAPQVEPTNKHLRVLPMPLCRGCSAHTRPSPCLGLHRQPLLSLYSSTQAILRKGIWRVGMVSVRAKVGAHRVFISYSSRRLHLLTVACAPHRARRRVHGGDVLPRGRRGAALHPRALGARRLPIPHRSRAWSVL